MNRRVLWETAGFDAIDASTRVLIFVERKEK